MGARCSNRRPRPSVPLGPTSRQNGEEGGQSLPVYEDCSDAAPPVTFLPVKKDLEYHWGTLEAPRPRRPLVLAPGYAARLTALRKAGAEKFNGLTVTVLHSEGPKWVVQLPGGQKASIPAANLQLKVKIARLRSGQGKLYNSTVATLVEWNPTASKWLVELFTGVQALIPAENLEPVETLSDS
eukprot:s879_g7.t6